MMNQRPIIGVVAQEVQKPTPERKSYICASYIKYLESAGARVIPILIDKSDDEYKALFNSINGVLFPGGSASLETSAYARITQMFFELAKEANGRDDYFPVWGTCLGFEQMACLMYEKDTVVLSTTNNINVALPLNFTDEAKDSRLFKDVPSELMQALATEPLTANVHDYSVEVETFNKLERLNKFYRALSTNTYKNRKFISTMEAYDYPFYAVQWHPEKNSFEWSCSYIPHSPSAIKVTFYMAEFFVNEARKNFHKFESEEKEQKALIYNYTPVYTRDNSNWEQMYFFS